MQQLQLYRYVGRCWDMLGGKACSMLFTNMEESIKPRLTCPVSATRCRVRNGLVRPDDQAVVDTSRTGRPSKCSLTDCCCQHILHTVVEAKACSILFFCSKLCQQRLSARQAFQRDETALVATSAVHVLSVEQLVSSKPLDQCLQPLLPELGTCCRGNLEARHGPPQLARLARPG